MPLTFGTRRGTPFGKCSGWLANDLQIRTTFEYCVVGDEKEATPHGSCRDPKITGVNFLMQRMPFTFAGNPEVCERCSRQIVGRHHIRGSEQSFERLQPPPSPTSANRTEASLGDDLRRDDQTPSGHVRPVPYFQRRAFSERRRKNSRVNADRRRSQRHSLSAATNRSHSSSVRSSIA
jgi:hypothetical protein